MKKKYMKPLVMFEDFSMSTNIASNCDYISNHAINECSIVDNGWIVFTNETICADLQFEDEYQTMDGDTICYHSMTSDNNVFTS